MTKLVTTAIAALTIVFALNIQAGEKAAAKGVKLAKAADVSLSDKLNLTETQVKKLSSLKTTCDGIGCKVSSAKKYQAGIKSILTSEQFASFEKDCEANGGCRATGAAKLQASLASVTKKAK